MEHGSPRMTLRLHHSFFLRSSISELPLQRSSSVAGMWWKDELL